MVTRLQEKLITASGSVARQYKTIEARADAMIAREAELEKKTHAAFAPHEALLTQAEQGLTDLSKQLDLMTNGAPIEGVPSPLQDTTQPHAQHGVVTDSDGKVVS